MNMRFSKSRWLFILALFVGLSGISSCSTGAQNITVTAVIVITATETAGVPTQTATAPATETATAIPTSTEAKLTEFTPVTDIKDIGSAPDGSTPEKRAIIAKTLEQMFADGAIPNFDPSIPDFVPTQQGAFNNADFNSFFWTNNDFTDVANRSLKGATLVRGENGITYGVQAVKQPGTKVPGFNWYQISPKNADWELKFLFNKISYGVSLPWGVKGTQACIDIYGSSLCKEYSDPAVYNAQDNAIKNYLLANGITPDDISSGRVIFLMNRQTF